MLPAPETATFVHTAFEWTAFTVGGALYRQSIRRGEHMSTLSRRQRLTLLFGAAAGAAFGSKLAFLMYDPEAMARHARVWLFMPGGQSVVGGLAGGLIGVEISKHAVGVRASTGDAFVVPILVALIIGRVGCFLAGLNDGTYGLPTTLVWGIDFGDGQRRHPTQIYDQVFALALLGALRWMRPCLSAVPGLQFKLMLSAYLLWRLLIDALKPKPFAYLGVLSGIQLLCVIALCAYLPLVIRSTTELWTLRRAGPGLNSSEVAR